MSSNRSARDLTGAVKGPVTMTTPPQSVEEILEQFEQGQLTPAEAFAMFRRLETRPGNPPRRVPEVRGKDPDDEAERRRRLAAVMDELDALIGLDDIKALVREIQAFVAIQQRRKQENLAAEPLVLHMIFKGNPLSTPVIDYPTA